MTRKTLKTRHEAKYVFLGARHESSWLNPVQIQTVYDVLRLGNGWIQLPPPPVWIYFRFKLCILIWLRYALLFWMPRVYEDPWSLVVNFHLCHAHLPLRWFACALACFFFPLLEFFLRNTQCSGAIFQCRYFCQRCVYRSVLSTQQIAKVLFQSIVVNNSDSLIRYGN